MADIIRPNFGKKKLQEGERKKEKSPEATNIGEAEQIPAHMNEASMVAATRDLAFVLKNTKVADDVRRKMDEITDYIFSLANFTKNDANIDLRRQGLKSASLEDLCNHILNSDKMQWGTQPSFFGAVMLEYRDRIKNARAFLPKERE